MRWRRIQFPLLLVLAFSLYGWASATLRQQLGKYSALEFETALPTFVQVVLAGGDRFLAANLGVFAVLTAETGEVPPEKLAIQAMIQANVSWLNQAHEDNYYLAAAALPWGGEFERADLVLAGAMEGRPFDFVPPFFRGFNHVYFRQDSLTGAQLMQIAADRADGEQNRLFFQKTAARWIERGSGPAEALRVLEGMQRMSRSQALKQHLQVRIEALKILIVLREAGESYQRRFGRAPQLLADLQRAGLLTKIPKAPQGQRFMVATDGTIVLAPTEDVKK